MVMLYTQATESECRHLIENELMRSIDAIDNEHKARISDLEIQLSQSEARIADLETRTQRSRHSSQQDAAGVHSDLQLRRQLSQSQSEISSLQSQLSAARTQLHTATAATAAAVPHNNHHVCQHAAAAAAVRTNRCRCRECSCASSSLSLPVTLALYVSHIVSAV